MWVPKDARRGCWIPWSWSYNCCEPYDVGGLGFELGSPGRAVCTLYHISLALDTVIVKIIGKGKVARITKHVYVYEQNGNNKFYPISKLSK